MTKRRPTSEDKAKQLAQEHWDWLGALLEHVYKDAMVHGFKHGVGRVQQNRRGEKKSPPLPDL